MIDRNRISIDEAETLDDSRDAATSRRARNTAARRCLNDTLAGTHGLATHGVLCLACRETHRGHTLESSLGRERYLEVKRQSLREGRPLKQVAFEIPVSQATRAAIRRAAFRGGADHA